LSPVIVAFSGTHLWRPLASCPIPLVARNVEWEDNIEDLARGAACVAFDSSDASSSIQREIEIVRRVVPPEKILWLGREAVSQRIAGQSFSGRALQYTRSWWAALPRMLMEFVVVGLAPFAILGTIAADPQFAWIPLWVLLIAGAAVLALAAPVILQPSVSHGLRRKMKEALASVLFRPGREAMSARPKDLRPPICAVVCPPQSQNAAFLSEAVSKLGMRAWTLTSLAEPRPLREAIRRIADARVVIVDVSTFDPDVEYLLGTAHGLGRKVVLVSNGDQVRSRGTMVHKIDSGLATSMTDLACVIEKTLRDPFEQGPVSALLANKWVFGERLAWRRIAAFLIDAALSVGFLAYFFRAELTEAQPILWWFNATYATVLVNIFFRFLCLALSGTTVGMAIAGLRLLDAEGGNVRLIQAFGWSAGLLIAFSLPFSNALPALFGPRYQVLEDLLFHTRVVKR